MAAEPTPWITPTLVEIVETSRAARGDEARALVAGLDARGQPHGELARLLGEGKLADALAVAERLWRRGEFDPVVPALLTIAGHADAGDAAAALGAGRRTRVAGASASLAEAPGSLDRWAVLLQALIARGRVDEALRGVELALGAGVAARGLWALLASLLTTLGHPGRLGDVATLVLHATPWDSDGWALRALADARGGALGAARAAATIARRLHPAAPMAWLAIATVERSAGATARAEGAMARALALGLLRPVDPARCRAVLRVRCARERARFGAAVERAAGRPDGAAIAEYHAHDRALAALLAEGADPLLAIASAAGLSDVERDFLSAVVGVTVDPHVAELARRLQGSSARSGLSVATYALVTGLEDTRRIELVLDLASPARAIRGGLIDGDDSSAAPAMQSFRASDRTLGYVGDGLTARAAPTLGLEIVEAPPAAILDEAQERLIQAFARALISPDPTVIVIDGATSSGRSSAIGVLAARLGRAALACDLGATRADRTSSADALAYLAREQRLVGALPVLRGLELASEPDRARVTAYLDEADDHVVVMASSPDLPIRTRHRVLRFHWPFAATSARRTMWAVVGRDQGGVDDDALDQLAQRYQIGVGSMMRAVRAARALTPGAAPLTIAQVVDGIRQDLFEQMTGLATRTRTHHRWDDLILAADTREQVRALIARVRHGHHVYERWGLGARSRATGTAALFSGPPGTGKTMVAGLIAAELDLDLYQVDLSQVVSKWVGETEKQLSRLFEAASTGSCLLLFDEADALFAKRTEVRSSNDRYANLEVNYLLQRIESFGGVVILTTNLEAVIDPAFKRRLASHVTFWPPDEEDRVALWRGYLASGPPVDEDLDVEALAEDFGDLSGAQIRNAMLTAAFSAADAGGPIRQAQLEAAARGEYATLGRVLGKQRP